MFQVILKICNQLIAVNFCLIVNCVLLFCFNCTAASTLLLGWFSVTVFIKVTKPGL